MTPDIDLDAFVPTLAVPDLMPVVEAELRAEIKRLTAELERVRAEVERLKVERGEALLWSPWNDHDVLFEQWAKRRAGAGDGEQDTATRPAPIAEDDTRCHLMERESRDGDLVHARKCWCQAAASVQGAADGEAQA